MLRRPPRSTRTDTLFPYPALFRDRIRTLRTGGGLSGFTKRSESEYDPFGAAHSSTSISAALGFAVANKLKDQPGRAIAVIGDGSMSAGKIGRAAGRERVCQYV